MFPFDATHNPTEYTLYNIHWHMIHFYDCATHSLHPVPTFSGKVGRRPAESFMWQRLKYRFGRWGSGWLCSPSHFHEGGWS